MTRLLVASGVGTVASVEVINLDKSKPDLVCDNLPDLPSKIHKSHEDLEPVIQNLIYTRYILKGGEITQFKN
jgi:hypothetical protein